MRVAAMVAVGAICAGSAAASTPPPPVERIDVSTAGMPGEVRGVSPSLSADGRFVAFASSANNLVPGDTNGPSDRRDIFVRDRATSTTERVSVATDGSQGADGESDSPSISADGRYVAFMSHASSLVAHDSNHAQDVFVHDRVQRRTTRVSVRSDGGQSHGTAEDPVISPDARFVAFQAISTNLVRGDTGRAMRIYVRDRRTGRTSAVSPPTGDWYVNA